MNACAIGRLDVMQTKTQNNIIEDPIINAILELLECVVGGFILQNDGWATAFLWFPCCMLHVACCILHDVHDGFA